METEKTKLDMLSIRIEQYKQAIDAEIQHYVENHNHYLMLIDQTGMNDPEMDPVLLGPMTLARIEIWYSMARKEAYSISGKCRDLQKYYLSAAEQAKANRYEEVRLKQYSPEMHTSTDAKEMARRVGGRLEEKAAFWEGEYLRWHGVGDSYEQTVQGVKDIFKLAEYEWQLSKKLPS